MVVNDRGPLYQGAAGTKGVGRSEPMTIDTIFWYASMTKALVATGAMQLIEQGRLKLDEPASAILPQLASVQVLDGFDGGRGAEAQTCQAANHAASIAHPHGWLRIQLGERRRSFVILKRTTSLISLIASGARSTSRCSPTLAIDGNMASASIGSGN